MNFLGARDAFQKAAALGHAGAQVSLGLMYDNGQSGQVDHQEAVRLYRLAAAQGDPTAMHNLGCCYRDGEVVARDLLLARLWFEKAASEGHAGAQVSLGQLYNKGLSVPKDEKQAVRLYQLAAAQGDATAQFNLGCCALDGTGLERNTRAALRFFLSARKLGHVAAARFVRRLEREMHQVVPARASSTSIAGTTIGPAGGGGGPWLRGTPRAKPVLVSDYWHCVTWGSRPSAKTARSGCTRRRNWATHRQCTISGAT